MIDATRVLRSHQVYGVERRSHVRSECDLRALSIRSAASVRVDDDRKCMCFEFRGNVHAVGVYVATFSFNEEVEATGAAVRLRLRNWKQVSYFAFGIVSNTEYLHDKVMHPRQDREFTLVFSVHDLLRRVQQDAVQGQQVKVSGIKLFLKGTPEVDGGHIEVGQLAVFDEGHVHDFPVTLPSGRRLFSEITSWWQDGRPFPTEPSIRRVLHEFDKKQQKRYKESADYYLAQGGLRFGEWLSNTAQIMNLLLPSVDMVSHNNTLRYSYHALKHVNALLLVAEEQGTTEHLIAARELLAEWLDKNFFGPGQDGKYTWYDHGTAERQLVLIRMWNLGLKHQFDLRFMARLLYAIKQHGDLLCSEAFYARDQRVRYHNHAVFQDLALLATAVAFPWIDASAVWKATAIDRMQDQFDHLFETDGDCAVLTENSLGYHAAFVTILDCVAGLLEESHDSEWLPRIADLRDKVSRFVEVVRYPDGRLPAIGDTARQPNSLNQAARARQGEHTLGFWSLDRAGYVIAKGVHQSRPFQFTLVAPSLTATHKHVDNLSFTLFLDGVEWLIDPSFYSHQYADPIPAYLRGPEAHNALVAVGTSYTIEPNLATLQAERYEMKFRVVGAHRACPGMVIHRSVCGRLDRLSLWFTDLCETTVADQKCRLLFHLGEHVTAVWEADGYTLSSPLSPLQLRLIVSGNYPSRVYVGAGDPTQTETLFGWSATGFLRLESITTIVYEVPAQTVVSWSLTASDH